MTTRIDRRFAELAREGRAALVTYTVAGDPDIKTSLEILKALPKAGADVIELGMMVLIMLGTINIRMAEMRQRRQGTLPLIDPRERSRK